MDDLQEDLTLNPYVDGAIKLSMSKYSYKGNGNGGGQSQSVSLYAYCVSCMSCVYCIYMYMCIINYYISTVNIQQLYILYTTH